MRDCTSFRNPPSFSSQLTDKQRFEYSKKNQDKAVQVQKAMAKGGSEVVREMYV